MNVNIYKTSRFIHLKSIYFGFHSIEVLSTVSKIKVTEHDQQYYFRAFEEVRSNLEITLTKLAGNICIILKFTRKSKAIEKRDGIVC